MTNQHESVTQNDNQLQIVYVENDYEAFHLVRIFLKDKYRLIMAKNEAEAEQKIDGKNTSLILMDIALSKKDDGIELTKKIKASEDTKHIPIIALTAYAMKSDIERFSKAGMDGYITKPFSRKDLESKVEKLINSNIQTITKVV